MRSPVAKQLDALGVGYTRGAGAIAILGALTTLGLGLSLAACGGGSGTPSGGGQVDSGSGDGARGFGGHRDGGSASHDATADHVAPHHDATTGGDAGRKDGGPDDAGSGASPSCTLVTGTTGKVVDASGNVWTLASRDGGFVVDENGAAAGFTAEVTELAYVNGVVSQENVVGLWWSWNGTAWVSEGDPTTTCGAGVGDAGDATTSTDGSTAYFYGINDHPEWDVSIDVQNAEVELMAAAGVQSVRIDIDWFIIEQTQGDFGGGTLAYYDNFIQQCQAHNIEVLGILLDPPAWANGTTSNPNNIVPPSDLSATAVNGGPGSPLYNAFVSFALDRWGVHGTSPSGAKWIKAWEIWNEPDGSWAWAEPADTTSPWGAGNPDPVKYAELLKGAYTLIKATDPTALVLGPSSSGADPNSATFDTTYALDGGFQGNWIETLYHEGIKDYFDVYSAHVYNSDYNPTGEPTPSPPNDVLARITNNLLPIMEANGDGAKRMWITETGYYSGPLNAGDPATVDAGTQAEFLTEGYAYAKAHMPNVDRLFWYDLAGLNTGSSNQEYFCVLATAPGNFEGDAAAYYTPKLAYDALKAIPK